MKNTYRHILRLLQKKNLFEFLEEKKKPVSQTVRCYMQGSWQFLDINVCISIMYYKGEKYTHSTGIVLKDKA